MTKSPTTLNAMGSLAGDGIRLRRTACNALSVSDRTPRISKPLLTWFTWYSRRYLRRHFNSLRVTGPVLTKEILARPLVVYSNHASWWDPLVGLMLSGQLLPGKSVFAPMDADALKRYGFFKRLGMFGVDQHERRGGVQFLRRAREILQTSENVLWLTPQSRFADARERPVRFEPGIGHLPGLAREISFVPVALEYVFWEERLPEILVCIGQVHHTTSADRSVKAQWWSEFFADRMRETQDELARHAQHREMTVFQCLLRGNSGVGGIYDRWRRFKAGWRGEQIQLEHGKL